MSMPVKRARLPFEFHTLRAGEAMRAAMAEAASLGMKDVRVELLTSEVSEVTRRRSSFLIPGWRVEVSGEWAR